MAITDNETLDDSSNEEYDSSSEKMKDGDQITLEINEGTGTQKELHSLKLELDDLKKGVDGGINIEKPQLTRPVSYKHLTLQTICSL